jgi:hypothetical protein
MPGFLVCLDRINAALDGMEALGEEKLPCVEKWVPRIRVYYQTMLPALEKLAEEADPAWTAEVLAATEQMAVDFETQLAAAKSKGQSSEDP